MTARLDALVLFNLALAAHRRLDGCETTSGGNPDALISILLAASSLEALIEEIVYLAESMEIGHPLRTLADTVEHLERQKTNMGAAAKYQVARHAICGKTFDKGLAPFSEFLLLFRVRNAIVHLKPDSAESSTANLAADLHRRHLCESIDPSGLGWLDAISTRSVARWACNVVPDMLDGLLEVLPKGERGTMILFDVLRRNAGAWQRIA